MRLAVSMRPSVRLLPLYILNQLTFDLDFFFAFVWVITIAHRRLRVKVVGQGQKSMQCATWMSTMESYEY